MNDAGTVRRLRMLRRALIDPAIRTFRGRIINTAGDSLMIMFDSVDAAMQCALRVQQQVPVHDGDQPPDRRIRFRIGIHLGDVIADRHDVHGDGSNIAARLQSISPVGGICVSRAVHDHVAARLGIHFEPIGPQVLKNIAQPVEAFILKVDPTALSVPSKKAVIRRIASLAPAAVLLVVGVSGAAWWVTHEGSGRVTEATGPTPETATRPESLMSKAPRLSLVVFPFDNLDHDTANDSIADGLTEDLTTNLAQKQFMVVTARNSAFSFKGKPVNVKQAGAELGVRYALEGSIRKLGASLRINAQLISAETGVHLWAYQIDTETRSINTDQDDAVRSIGREIYRQLIEIESIRGARERPNNSDAMDIILQAFALGNRPATNQLQSEILALYEHAVKIEPTSALALTGLAEALQDIPISAEGPSGRANSRRAESLIAKAETLQPRLFDVMFGRAYLLFNEKRYPEAIIASQNVINDYPNTSSGYHYLGSAQLFNGQAAEAIDNLQHAIRIDPHNAQVWNRFRRLGQASLFLGRYDDAIYWERRALAARPGADDFYRGFRFTEIAAAQAFAGHIEEARAAAAEALRLNPLTTIRGWWGGDEVNPTFAAQIAHVEEALRLTDLPDHTDEGADFGVASSDNLSDFDWSRTPRSMPGARTMLTADLVAFLANHKPVIIDVSARRKSIPGAIGLLVGGADGNMSDNLQTRLSQIVEELTHGDRHLPIVTVAWNADRFASRNLALRLVALGYTDVIWYRGGREAWDAAGQTEGAISPREW